ncbi:MAG: hypothetical protein MUC51_07840 [Anaerolineae bacterium]|jgi:hypothetical protein|nr:hypothetical protein [Anaerolineae bacterium]
MTYQTPMVSLQIPAPIYRRLRRAAELTYRSIEDVLATTVDAALPSAPDLPPDLADDLAAMAMFSDAALWAATESSLSAVEERRLRQLTHARGRRSVSAAESAELQRLLDAYDRSVLRRAKAFAILAQRGYELPDRPDFSPTADDDE